MPDYEDAWTITADNSRVIAAMRLAAWGMPLRVNPAVAPLLKADA
jgi:hypothetical protein